MVYVTFIRLKKLSAFQIKIIQPYIQIISYILYGALEAAIGWLKITMSELSSEAFATDGSFLESQMLKECKTIVDWILPHD